MKRRKCFPLEQVLKTVSRKTCAENTRRMCIVRCCLIFVMILQLCIFILPVDLYATEDSSEANEYETIINSGFELNGFDGWTAFGKKSVITITDKKAHSGKYSLLTSERVASWSGPTLNLTGIVDCGSEIMIRSYALSASNKETEIMISLRYFDDSGVESYDTIVNKEVGTDDWVLLENSFTIPENAYDVCIYFETADNYDDFYLDDIEISCKQKSTESNNHKSHKNDEHTDITYDFRDGMSGWMPRGNVTLEISEERGYKDKYSLYVANRSAFWNSPMVRLNSVKTGVTYTYSAMVMYMNKNVSSYSFSINLQYNLNGEEVYSKINTNSAPDGTWKTISGDFIIPNGATDIYFFIQGEEEEGADEFISFYVDDVRIIDTSAQKKNRVINIIIICSILTVILAGITMLTIMFIKKSKAAKKAIIESSIDSMTMTYNRNAFEERMNELEKNPAKCIGIYVTVCDVNFLKYINDNYGHDSGDKAIIRCATVLLKVIGKRGKVYRTGGDEFMCITEVDITNEIKAGFVNESMVYKGYPFAVAVGTAEYDSSIDGSEPDIKVIVARSDKAMYKHKVEIKKAFDFS